MIHGLIVAGSREEARDWMRENKLSFEDYRYVSRQEDCLGYHNIPVFAVGQYYNNQAYTFLVCFNGINYIQDNFENLPATGAGKDHYLVWNKNRFITERKLK